MKEGDVQVNYTERTTLLMLAEWHRSKDRNTAPEARAGSLSPHPAQNCIPD